MRTGLWTLFGLMTLAMRLAAQPSNADSLPFHRGQWAVEFPIESDIGTGLLRFMSPHTALFIYPRAELSRERQYDDIIPYSDERTTELSLSIGQRNYQVLARRTVGLFTLGITPSIEREYRHWRFDGGNTTTSATQTWRLGIFAEFGADYMVTPHLSVGARAGFAVSRYRRAPYLTRGHVTTGSNVGISGTRITAALYF